MLRLKIRYIKICTYTDKVAHSTVEMIKLNGYKKHLIAFYEVLKKNLLRGILGHTTQTFV